MTLEYIADKQDLGVIDFTAGVWVHSPKTDRLPNYQYTYDGKYLVCVERCFDHEGRLILGVKTGTIIVSKDTVLLNARDIYTTLSFISVDDIDPNIQFKLIEGVPGCGKTSEIITSHDVRSKRQIVLTSSRKVAKDLRERVAKEYRVDEASHVLITRYRTCDSFMIHFERKPAKADVLWFDDGLMRHFGDIVWCATLCGAKKVYIY